MTPECPWCGGTDLTSPLDFSEDGGDENWWCQTCTDYIPTPAGVLMKPHPAWRQYKKKVTKL